MEALFAGFSRAPDGTSPVEDISIEVFAPPSYNSKRPAGVLVFISPATRAHPPARLHPVFERQNLIWVSVNEADDTTDDWTRMVSAYGALRFILSRYEVDRSRLYLGGLDGGAEVAAEFAQRFPAFFSCYIFFGGADEVDPRYEELARYARRARYAFVTGDADYNRDETERGFRSFKDADFNDAQYFEFRGLSNRLPDAADFEDVVDFLDER